MPIMTVVLVLRLGRVSAVGAMVGFVTVGAVVMKLSILTIVPKLGLLRIVRFVTDSTRFMDSAMIPRIDGHALCEHVPGLDGCDYRVIAIDSLKRVRSTLRVARRGCAGKHFCIVSAKGRKIGDYIKGPAFAVPLH